MIEIHLKNFLERRPSFAESQSLADFTDTKILSQLSAQIRDEGHGNIISYSCKIFIPLTKLCRDFCHYCTFADAPKKKSGNYMTLDEVMEIAKRGEAAGCKEALFTLGDKPELRYRTARAELAELGHDTTISYLAEIAEQVISETRLLPHINAGVMSAEDLRKLRKVSVSQGLMLESSSRRLCEKGGPHYGSPDKFPQVRLQTIRLAGIEKIPFTSGILIGIGETRFERIESLLALRELHEQYGHLQEIIIQNFRPKPGTKMVSSPEPNLDELIWTIAVARIIFGPGMNIQAPPNLSAGNLSALVGAGINDWGGVSPVTPDHVNPEAPWPELVKLSHASADGGKQLTERLAVYPSYAIAGKAWLDEAMRPQVLRLSDGEGFAREDSWSPGQGTLPPKMTGHPTVIRKRLVSQEVEELLAKTVFTKEWSDSEVERLLRSRGDEFEAVCSAADNLRKRVSGEVVTYVVNRNINYTNICYFLCGFCAFSKGKMSENLRGKPYILGLDEIVRRTEEAWSQGATEVCLQGGIHPDYTGQTYLDICTAIKDAVPKMHIHAFSPLEVWQGASTLGLTVVEFLRRLHDAGLSSLPGTAAEVLDDGVRSIICPDKLTTEQWISVMRDAHDVGFRTTATLMYGHVETPLHIARHFLRLRELQRQTAGASGAGVFTEFVPLPFVHMEAPLYIKGKARKGPTFREAVLVPAVARLVLHPYINNIQTSWVKMGPEGIKVCLNAGVNDLGGTLMNESITRAAGAVHGQEMPPARMEALIKSVNRIPQQRTTLYGIPDISQHTIFPLNQIGSL